jgi:hypothetical protein
MNTEKFEISKDGKTLGLGFSKSGIDSEIKFILDKQISSISIKSSNFPEDKKLKLISAIEELFLTIDSPNFNLKSIFLFKKLKSLSIFSNKGIKKMELSEFEFLEKLNLDWFNYELSLKNNSNLLELDIWKFKPECKSFQCLSLPESLEVVHITETNIENFNGLKNTKVNQLEAYYCPRLLSLSGLKEIKEHLKILIIENAKNLLDFEDLWECENLEKIILTNCGTIPSLKNMPKLKKLKMFTFHNTTIEDGDLANLLNVEYVYFKNQKHYNLKLKDFENRK